MYSLLNIEILFKNLQKSDTRKQMNFQGKKKKNPPIK